jgi:hypothetical protein
MDEVGGGAASGAWLVVAVVVSVECVGQRSLSTAPTVGGGVAVVTSTAMPPRVVAQCEHQWRGVAIKHG